MDAHSTGHGACCETTDNSPPSAERLGLLRRALRLEFLTVGWNIVEGLVAVFAATSAGSVALLAFGVDSFVESASGAVLIWRLKAEQRSDRTKEAIEALDKQAHRLVGVTLFVLAAYVAIEALRTLYRGDAPDTSLLGIAVTAVSLCVMIWLARAKRTTAHALDSRALQADAFQTTACWWLSLIALTGVALNWLLAWWWADPVAALGMSYFLAREGREAWHGEDCCD